ncbi:MAG: hypothetical protein V3V14_08460 [Saprospiraceae bacterium]
MSVGTNITLIIIALHLVVGFAWLSYKVSPKKGEDEGGYIEYDPEKDKENNKHKS